MANIHIYIIFCENKYNKLKNKIIDIATQTSIFTQIELANVKSVQTLIFKKEIIKEQALIKCFDSLKKLKRFGIDII